MNRTMQANVIIHSHSAASAMVTGTSVFERGGDPTRMSKPDLKAAIAAGKLRAQTEKANYERAVSQLSPEERDEVEQLQKKLADRSGSEADKRAASDRIVAIFAVHN